MSISLHDYFFYVSILKTIENGIMKKISVDNILLPIIIIAYCVDSKHYIYPWKHEKSKLTFDSDVSMWNVPMIVFEIKRFPF